MATDWTIYIGPGFKRDLGEGPFDTKKKAVEFAESEVGVPWSVRRAGATPKATDKKGGPKPTPAARAARDREQIETNRRFSEELTKFQRENPNATSDEFKVFLAKWAE